MRMKTPRSEHLSFSPLSRFFRCGCSEPRNPSEETQYILAMEKQGLRQVLDIGCGNYKDPRATIGIDIDTTAKCDILMDAQKLDFPNECFDMVIMHQCLEHVEQPVTALREIHRVLKHGGIFELDIPNRLHFITWLRWWLRGRLWVDPGHIYAWTMPELHNILVKSGFCFGMDDYWCGDNARYNKPGRLARFLNPRVGRQQLHVRAYKPMNCPNPKCRRQIPIDPPTVESTLCGNVVDICPYCGADLWMVKPLAEGGSVTL